MRPEEGYVFGNDWEGERKRLQLLSGTFDKGTLPLLDHLGVGEGWRCLEVGAGEGSVARWLADRVGATGRVIATDIDPRFLESRPNLDVLTHDVVTDPLPEEGFDLVHSRMVFEHLPARDEVLERLAATLRPGGVILIEDMDWAGCASVTSLGGELIDKVVSSAMTFMGTCGYDQHYGRRLPVRMTELGLTGVDALGRVYLVRGNSDDNYWFRMSIERLKEPLVAGGWLTQSEFDEIFGLLDNPDFFFLSPTLVSVWGRRE